jgi:hypothetical protein
MLTVFPLDPPPPGVGRWLRNDQAAPPGHRHGGSGIGTVCLHADLRNNASILSVPATLLSRPLHYDLAIRRT